MCLKTKFRKAMVSLFNNSVVTDSTISMNINIREFNEKIEDIDPEIKSYLNNSISDREKRYRDHMYYSSVAKSISNGSTCLRKHVGAVIVKDSRIVSSGVNTIIYDKTCSDLQYCKKKNDIVNSKCKCKALHAEASAIINARESLNETTLYLSCTDMTTGDVYADIIPCDECKKLILSSGIKEVVIQYSNDIIVPVSSITDDKKPFIVIDTNIWK